MSYRKLGSATPLQCQLLYQTLGVQRQAGQYSFPTELTIHKFILHIDKWLNMQWLFQQWGSLENQMPLTFECTVLPSLEHKRRDIRALFEGLRLG